MHTDPILKIQHHLSGVKSFSCAPPRHTGALDFCFHAGHNYMNLTNCFLNVINEY